MICFALIQSIRINEKQIIFLDNIDSVCLMYEKLIYIIFMDRPRNNLEMIRYQSHSQIGNSEWTTFRCLRR